MIADATRLDDGDGNGAHPAVAMSGLSSAVVAWTQHRLGSFEGDLWVRRFALGRRSETTHFAGETASEVAVAIDGAGNVGLAAITGETLSARSYVAGAWTTATQLSAPDADSVHSPFLAADRCGNVLAVWGQSGGPTAFDSVWTSHYTPGAGWTSAGAVSSVGYDFDPVVASNAAGQALLAFELYGGGVSSVWANHLADGSVDGCIAGHIEGKHLERSRAPLGSPSACAVDLVASLREPFRRSFADAR